VARSWSLRIRVLAVVVTVELLVGALTLVALLDNARIAVREELAASERLAVGLVRAAVAAMVPTVPPARFMRELAERLPPARHVRFLVVDSRGDLQRLRDARSDTEATSPPAWLRHWLAVPARTSEVAIVVDGRMYGKVLVIADPGSELAEVWQDLREILAIGGLGFALLVMTIWGATVWALHPLHRLREALDRARAGEVDIRLASPGVQELVPVVETFNALMRDLGRTRAQREELTRRLVAAEDAERRSLALELHDEVGPCLFALRSEVARLIRAIGHDPSGEELRGRGEVILHVSQALEAAQRRVLARLRPIRAPGVTFTQQLEELLSDATMRAEDVNWEVEVDPAVDDASEIVQVTVYRLVQEAVTNVLRHARAARVRITVRREGDGVGILVVDDGCGFETARARGMGLHGMRERVQGLGGRFEADSEPGWGTVIRAWIPDRRGNGRRGSGDRIGTEDDDQDGSRG